MFLAAFVKNVMVMLKWNWTFDCSRITRLLYIIDKEIEVMGSCAGAEPTDHGGV
jgi:hypothetical protein